MVEAWHVSTDDRFDFAAPGSRLEVKTTATSTRRHEFRLHQLEPVDGAVTYVASIMTTELDAGMSVPELVDRVTERLPGDPLMQFKVQEQVARTLGADWLGFPQRFDEQQATKSLRVLNAAAIPRVAPPPPRVLHVDLTVDCSDVTVLEFGDLHGLGRLAVSEDA